MEQSVDDEEEGMQQFDDCATFDLDGYEEHWSDGRKILSKFLLHKNLENFLCFMLLCNLVLMIMQTDYEASGQGTPDWISVGNYILIGVYALELILRLYAWRQLFFRSTMNCLDLLVVVTDIFLEAALLFFDAENVPSVVFLRVFRILRMCRSRRAMLAFPELGVMVLGLYGALKAMFWGMVLLLLVFTCASILAVELIHPIAQQLDIEGAFGDCERCGRAYESVGAAVLTLVEQNIVGDSWGIIAIPIIERYSVTALFFASLLVIIGMTVLNLILAVVVDCGNQARHTTDRIVADCKQQEYQRVKRKLLDQCAAMDKDGNGSLTLLELKHGFRRNAVFRDQMEALGVDEPELVQIYRMMDESDGDGKVTFSELVHQLHRMMTEDQRTMTCLTRFYVTEIQREMREELKKTQEILALLHANVEETKIAEKRVALAEKGLVPETCDTLRMPALGTEMLSSDVQDTQGSGLQPRVTYPAHGREEMIQRFLGQLHSQVQPALQQFAIEVENHQRLFRAADGNDTSFKGSRESFAQASCNSDINFAISTNPLMADGHIAARRPMCL